MHDMIETVASDTADFVFSIDGAPTDELKVASFSGSEGLNELYFFRVELVGDDASVDFRTRVGKSCLLRIATDTGTRCVHGIVRSMQRLHEGTNRTHYAVEIVPSHWTLTRRVGCRIFQEHNCPDMTVPGIVKKVLLDAGIPANRLRLALHGKYDTREYVVQYRESELDFIARLMEEEGICYFFEHTADGHVMVLGDGPDSHAATSSDPEYPFRTPAGLVPEREHVFSVRDRQEVQFGAVSLDDFDFLNPGLQLDSELAGKDFSSLEFRDYPAGFTDRERGSNCARLRLEEFQCGRATIEMTATVRAMKPGFRFTLAEHPSEPLNTEYLVTHVIHRATQPQSGEEEAGWQSGCGYEVELRAIPALVPFRPVRKTPRPTVTGTQTAIVVGPKSEEVYVDQYGRVKVQFHWDREGRYNENSSCWIRVSQGWAGGQYGMVFLPRVGHEVIVDFLEGNPDRPIIVGRVFNADLMPIFELPDMKHVSGIWSQSTKGGEGCSALVFDDEKDEELVYLHSQKDLELTAERDLAEHYGRDVDTYVERHRRELLKGYHQAEIRRDHDEKIGGNKSQQVGGSVAESFGGAHSESCGSYYLTTSKGEVVIESASAITLKVGGNFVKVHGGGVDIMGTVVNINSGGSAGNGTGAALGEFEEVYEAEYAEPPGTDVSYNQDNEPGPDPDVEGESTEGPAEPAEEKLTSWIEIELVDEAGQPWPNEPFEITTPEGKVYRGTLDALGQAHVEVENPGECKISFPKLDMDAWERG